MGISRKVSLTLEAKETKTDLHKKFLARNSSRLLDQWIASFLVESVRTSKANSRLLPKRMRLKKTYLVFAISPTSYLSLILSSINLD